MHKILYIFVEGERDKDFFENEKIKQNIENLTNYTIKPNPYAKKTKKYEYLKKYIKSIQAIPNQDYIFLSDLDNPNLCVTIKKQNLIKKIASLEFKKTYIVKLEIESWILAGFNENSSNKIKIPKDTEKTNKEDFYNLLKKDKKLDRLSDLNIFLEALKHFSIELAKERNKSFDYFYKKVILKEKQ